MRTTKSGGRNGSLSIEQRQRLCRQAEENPSWTQTQLSKWVEDTFSVMIDRSTVSKVLKRREEYMHGSYNLNAKRLRGVKYPELDNLLKEWCLHTQASVSNISDRTIVAKAQKIASELNLPEGALSFSNGWVDRFKKRNGIRQGMTARGENVLRKDSIAVSTLNIRATLSSFKLEDIYSLGTTEIYYSYSRTEKREFSMQEHIENPRSTKERMLTLLCCNANVSDMIPPLVIGQHHNPHSLSNIQYEFSPLVVLSDQTLEKWLRWFDERVAGRRVILLLNDVYSRVTKKRHLQNVQLQLLPSKTTILTHPMSSGILENFWTRYKYNFAFQLVQRAELESAQAIPHLDILDALMLIAESWYGIPADAIRNSWSKTKILPLDNDVTRFPCNTPELISTMPASLENSSINSHPNLTREVENIMDRLSRVAPTMYVNFLELIQESLVIDEVPTSLFNEPICPTTTEPSLNATLCDTSNRPSLEFFVPEKDASESGESEPQSDSNLSVVIDTVEAASSTAQATIQTSKMPIRPHLYYSAHGADQPPQHTLYSDKEAQEAIRNLCLYFCYRTHSEVGARLMLDAERILKEELKKRG